MNATLVGFAISGLRFADNSNSSTWSVNSISLGYGFSGFATGSIFCGLVDGLCAVDPLTSEQGSKD